MCNEREPASIDVMVAELDRRYPGWDMWRDGRRCWAVQIGRGADVFDGDTIGAALRKAFEFVPIPKIPRCPKLLGMNLMCPVRNGSYWRLEYDGQDAGVQTKTKTAAMESAEMLCRKSREAIDRWQEKYATLVRGVEGKDFQWEY